MSNIFLCLGPESGKKSDFIKQLKSQLTAKGDLDFYNYYSFDQELQSVISLLKNESLFSAHTMVVYNNCEAIKTKADVSLVKEFASSKSGNATLVLASDGMSVDKKLKDLIPKQNQKIFWELFENEKKGFIQRQFREHNKRISQDAVEMLLEMIENNTSELAAQCNRVIQYYSDLDTIEAEQIEKIIYHSKEENVFTLFARICHRDLEGALEITEKLLMEGSNQIVGLVAGLSWQLQRLEQVIYFIHKHYSPGEACKKAGVRGKSNEANYQRASREFNLHQIRDAITKLEKTDLQLRSNKTDFQPHLLKMLLFSIIR